MENKDKRMSIIIVTCDAYSDIVDYYLHYFETNWPDCQFETYIAEEKINHNSHIAKSIICGSNTAWTARAKKAIAVCQSPYILLSVDDLFISKKVRSEEFTKILDFMGENGIKYYRIPTFKTTKWKYPTYKDNINVEKIPKGKAYGRSIGTSIWERGELLDLLGDGTKSAWDLENEFCREANESKYGYYESYVSDRRFLLNSVHMIKGGKWIPKSIKKMKRLGYSINWETRGVLPLKERIRIWVYGTLGRLCPQQLRVYMKRILGKVGFKFATKY